MRAFALGCVVFLCACSLPSVGLWSGEGKADTGLYSLYGNRIVDGHVPYRSGFSMEFPPGAIPALALPAVPGSHYVAWFKAFAFLCGVAAIGAIAYARPRHRYRAVIVAGVAPALLGPITLNSFDLWPAALAAWAVALTVRGHERWGLAFLGAATAAKLYPLLLAPALLTYARDRVRSAAIGAAVVVAAFAPFAVLAPGGLKESLRVQAERGLQVESLGGSILGVAHRLGADVSLVVSHAPFSFDIGGSAADALGWISSLLVLAAVAAAWWLCGRDVFRSAAAAAVAFVAFAKVLSPQYLLFLVPLVPLVDSLAASALLLLALGLTQVWARFPQPFLDTVHLGGRIWVVLARNLVLVALYVLLVTRPRTSTKT